MIDDDDIPEVLARCVEKALFGAWPKVMTKQRRAGDRQPGESPAAWLERKKREAKERGDK